MNIRKIIREVLEESLELNENSSYIHDLQLKFIDLRNKSRKVPFDSPEYKDIKTQMNILKGEIKQIESGSEEIKDKPDGFSEWFKGSKVVDSDGNPKIVYHATTSSSANYITDNGFDLEKNLFGAGAGISFMTNEKMTRPYNRGGLIRAFVRLKNPMSFETNFEIREKIIKQLTGKDMADLTIDEWREYSPEILVIFRNEAEKLGYDGVYDSSQVELTVLDSNDVWVIKN